jgi:MSHA biogenesis protein MshK
MSLINDALKRAKQAQQHAQPSPPPELQFRPVESSQQPKRRLDWVVPTVVAMLGVIAFIFMWPWAQKNASNSASPQKPQTIVAAKEASPTTTASVAGPQTAPDSSKAAAPAQTPVVAIPDTNKIVIASEPPAPKPPPLKLQAIVYSPTRPSAIINGRSLFIGEKVGDLRVTAISQESATLTGSGQTNVLTLIP